MHIQCKFTLMTPSIYTCIYVNNLNHKPLDSLISFLDTQRHRKLLVAYHWTFQYFFWCRLSMKFKFLLLVSFNTLVMRPFATLQIKFFKFGDRLWHHFFHPCVRVVQYPFVHRVCFELISESI